MCSYLEVAREALDVFERISSKAGKVDDEGTRKPAGRVGKEAGVGINTIVRIETGEITEPRVSPLRKLAKALDLSPAQLLED